MYDKYLEISLYTHTVASHSNMTSSPNFDIISVIATYLIIDGLTNTSLLIKAVQQIKILHGVVCCKVKSSMSIANMI